MAGAGVMCVRGALRGGAGLVICCISRDIIPIIQISVPQGMCKDIEEAEAINLIGQIKTLNLKVKRKKAIVRINKDLEEDIEGRAVIIGRSR